MSALRNLERGLSLYYTDSMALRKLPIGIQDFESLRTGGCVYVDKTAYIYKLAHEGKPYFLGRPRRFGKSLFLSTLKAYFQGRKDLFEFLAISELEKEWIKYPVFHIDLNVANYNSAAALESGLDINLRYLEEKWGRDVEETTSSSRFLGLIHRASEKSGKKVVVLIDEYDQPLLQTMDDPPLQDELRRELRAFYGILKTADPWLQFIFLTGVTQFSQVSIFSGFNQLQDISMNSGYAGICGISESELTGNFDGELRELAEANSMTYEQALAEMQKRYNGYHFCENSEGIFNPFSVLNTFSSRKFAYYWFRTGTPTFLANQFRKANFDPRDFSGNLLTFDEESIINYRAGSGSLIPILYQSGYLTIKDYDRDSNLYTLGFPNEEVEYGFLNALFPLYGPQGADTQEFFIGKFFVDLQKGDVDAFMTRLRAFFAAIPYELNDQTERHYQTLFYLVFTLMGQYTRAEVRSAQGRADAVVFTKDTVYVFEFKLAQNESADLRDDALKQIDSKGYLIPYTAGSRRLVKIGAQFNADTRTLGNWKMVIF
ncbi:ATPase AAA [Spirochaetia bacterium]|nr:ATPase AAA [Spirochaetia bacterium]